MRNERRPVAALERERDAALRTLVHRAYQQVPFYRRLFDRAGVTPDDIRTAQDLRKLPVTDKRTLRAQPLGELLRAGERVERLTKLSTSGSSGAPFDVYLDARARRRRKAQSLRPYLSNGRRIGDVSVLLTGRPDHAPKWLERLGVLRDRRVDCQAPPEWQLAMVNAARPDILQGYPSALAALAVYLREREHAVHRPRLIFSDSELLSAEDRRLIEETFCAPVIDVYGTWETGNIAYQCELRGGLHLAIDCAVVELLKDDGSPARAGEEGRLVCTMLDNDAMPLIRYDLGDIASLSGEPCACGRSFPLLKVLSGRADDQLRLADGFSVSPRNLVARFGAMSELVKEYQIVQEEVERFRVAVVPGPGFDPSSPARIRAIFEAWRPSVEVTVEQVDEIPRGAAGKRRAFRSLVSARR